MLLGGVAGEHMIEVQIRQQGSSAIMTLPSDALKIMCEKIGNTLLIDVEHGKLVARSKQDKPRRLKLSEILAGIDETQVTELYRQSAFVQTGGQVGEEFL